MSSSKCKQYSYSVNGNDKFDKTPVNLLRGRGGFSKLNQKTASMTLC